MPDFKNKNSIIKLDDKLSIKMKAPTYLDILENNTFQTDASPQDSLTRMILSCIESVQTEEENILMKDESLEEKINFVDYLTMEQYEKVTEFISDMPSLSFEIETNCESCGTKNNRSMEGVNNFF